MQLRNFGDVIIYRSEQYVYLAQIDTIIYLAKLCSREISDNFIKVRDQIFASGNKKRQDSDAWCFVQLTTEQFKERIAHLQKPDYQEDFFDYVGTLNDEDKNELVKTILEDSRFMPKELVIFVKTLGVA